MTPEQFEKRLRELLHQRPFQPFAITLENGERFIAAQAESLFYHEGETAVFFHFNGDIDFVNCDAVREIVELVPATTSKS